MDVSRPSRPVVGTRGTGGQTVTSTSARESPTVSDMVHVDVRPLWDSTGTRASIPSSSLGSLVPFLVVSTLYSA